MKTIADVIDDAINYYLWDGSETDPKKAAFSCNAICLSESPTAKIVEFLNELGCSTNNIMQFNEFEYGPRCQYARALWLTWAAMIAREEETK